MFQLLANLRLDLRATHNNGVHGLQANTHNEMEGPLQVSSTSSCKSCM